MKQKMIYKKSLFKKSKRIEEKKYIYIETRYMRRWKK